MVVSHFSILNSQGIAAGADGFKAPTFFTETAGDLCPHTHVRREKMDLDHVS